MDQEEKKDKIFTHRIYNPVRFVRPGVAMQLNQPPRLVQSNSPGLVRHRTPITVVRAARVSPSAVLLAQSKAKDSAFIGGNGSISKTLTQFSNVETPKVSEAVGNDLYYQPFVQRSVPKFIMPKPGLLKMPPSKSPASLKPVGSNVGSASMALRRVIIKGANGEPRLVYQHVREDQKMIADARSLINESESEKGDEVADDNIFTESGSSEGSGSPNSAVLNESILPKSQLREKSCDPLPLKAASRLATEEVMSKKTPMILQRSPLRREGRILTKGAIPNTLEKPKIIISGGNSAVKIQSGTRVFEGLNRTQAGTESKDTVVTAAYSETDSISVSSDSQSSVKLVESSSFYRQSNSSKEEDIEVDKTSQEIVGELEDKNVHEESSTEAIVGTSSIAVQEDWHSEKDDSPASTATNRFVMDKTTMKLAKVLVVPATHKNVTKPVSLLKKSPYRNLVCLEDVSTQSEDEEEVPRSRRTFSPRKQRLKALLKDDQAVLSIKIRNPEGKTTETSQENRNCKQINQQLQEDIGQAIDEAISNISSNQGSPAGLKKPKRRSKNQKALFQGKGFSSLGDQEELPANLVDRILSRKQAVQNKEMMQRNYEVPQLKQYKRRRNSSDSLEGILKIQKLEELPEEIPEIISTPDLEDPLVLTEDEDLVDMNLKLIQRSRKHNRSFLKNQLGFYEVDFNACPRAFKQLKDNGVAVCTLCKNYFSIDESPVNHECSDCFSSEIRQKQLDLKASATNEKNEAGDLGVRPNVHINIYKPIPCIHFSSSDADFSWPLYFASDDDWKSSEPILNTRPCGISGFSVGQKLEAIDPNHPTLFCVVTIADVKGRRLRLTFDGYDRKFDFWVLDTSPDIFPAGWCDKNERKLQTPPNNIAEFTWEKYLKTTKSEAAPSNLFTIPNQKISAQFNRQIKKGMKLEALDMNYDRRPCVATIADVIGARILVHFDSWDQKYDYWTDIQSPRIFPVGYATENSLRLTTPKGVTDFSWETYLSETKSEAVPSPLLSKFRRPSIPWKVGMKVEAVDLRNPGFVRVATVTETENNSIKIHYDGWPSHFSVIVDEDSSDLFQPGWCKSSRCQLLPPLAVEDLRERILGCSTPGCIGLGSARRSGAPFHYTLDVCPYSDENLMTEDFPERVPNLLPVIADTLCSIESFRQDTEELAVEPPPPALFPVASQEEVKQVILNTVEKPEPTTNLKLSGWEKLNKTLLSNWPLNLKVSQISSFSPEEVGQLVQNVTGLQGIAEKIVQQEISGSVLVSLSQTDLRDFNGQMTSIGIKKGPATTLYRIFNFLRLNVFGS
ncbi:uncharacterized protein LOC136034943 [Artemia franciscana]|uniref:uncharacterized protein LOC136034943 n=1 Tax=Artemia franciscana TaxID=6661 RepID=UPI0032DAA95E